MKYDPKKKLFYYDIHSDEYKEADCPALHTTLYQYDDDLKDFEMVVMNEEKKTDNVNHPKHYEGSCSIECIDAMRFALGDEGLAYFCAGSAFKYLWRYKFKNGDEDLQKAGWYFNKLRYLRGNISNPTIKLLHERVMNLYITVTDKEENKAFEDEIPEMLLGYEKTTYICPTCASEIETEWVHCPMCGQKIDWSEDDDGSSSN